MSLEQIKDKLSECCKKHLPVLLYNDTSNKRNDLILTTHINNGGKTEIVQYIGSEKESSFLDNISSELNKWRNTELKMLTGNSTFRNLISVDKAEKDRIFQIREKIYNKVRDNFQSTEKTWTYLNGKGKNGESVYRKLINNEPWYEVRLPAPQIASKYSAKTREAPVPIQGSYLFDFRGVLFVDNLKCDNSNYKDIGNYCNLAEKIKKDKVSVNWLVVYIHNRDNFPELFLNQFKLISLDCQQEHQEGNVVLLKNEESSHIPPSGTKWSEVEMYLKDNEHFNIKIGEKQRIVTYSEMGFKHKTSTKKTELWSVLLRFAVGNNSPVGYYAEKNKVEKDIQRLNDALIKYFKINTNPITYQSEKKGYVAEFKIYNKSFLQEHMNSKAQAMSEEESLDEEIDRDLSR
jgi:hypothetical protein